MNIFLPWFLFSALYAVLSFSFHYQHPTWAWLLAYRTKKRDRDPMWYTFATLALLLAVVLAAVFGDMNFWYNMQPFYDIENLNTYPSVNPAREKGQQLMDAGRVYFADGAALDMQKAMGFKNLDLYCVAPIVHGQEQLASYDFWAVGLNCCSGVSSDFRCGEFNNPHARSGLRLMRDDQRPFFRLAVQQAEAAYNIKATHPLFFYWMQDPVAEMNSYRDDDSSTTSSASSHILLSTSSALCARSWASPRSVATELLGPPRSSAARLWRANRFETLDVA